MKTLKTAVIGVGNMGRHHARVYSEISNLVGVSDLDLKRAGELASKYGATAYDDYNEMIAKEKPDCVTIAVPTQLHEKIGNDVLKHCDVLMEKPIAIDENAGKSLIRASEASGHKLMVGHIERFNPVVQYLKEYIEKNNEQILAIDMMRLGIAPPKNPTTGVIVDLGIHDIDLFRYLTQEDVVMVDSTAKNFGLTDFEDHAHIFLKSANSSASIVTNWATPRKIRHLYATLSKSFIYLNYIDQTIEIYENNTPHPLKEEGPKKVVKLDRQEPLRLELEAFLGFSQGGENPVPGKDALESLKVALEAREKSK